MVVALLIFAMPQYYGVIIALIAVNVMILMDK
jgi:hypothetical protein